MTLQQFVDDKLVEILDRYSVPGQEVGASLKEAVLRSDNKELIIPVLGMQGMGKSTLINAILKEDIMPSEADETTCVPVEVKYGETEQAEVYFSSDTSTKIVHTKNELYEYVDNNSNHGNEKQVSRIVLHRKKDLLAKGLTIVDLPGVGSLTRANEETTNRYIKNLCTAIFVIPTVPTIRKTEAMFIKSVWSQFPIALFVQNRWANDTPQAVTESVQYNTMRLKQIAEQLNNPFDEHIIVVSAYDGIAGELQHNQKQIDDSNISELVSTISSLSDNWDISMSKALKEKVVNTLAFICSRIEARIEAQSKSQADKIREGEERIARFQSETEELKIKLNETKKMLRDKEDEVYGFVNEKTGEYAGKIRAGIHNIIDKGVVDGDKLSNAFEDIQKTEAEKLFDAVFDYINDLKLSVEQQIERYNQIISMDDDINFNTSSFYKAKKTKYEKVLTPLASASGGVGGLFAGSAITAKLTAAGAALSGPLAPVGALVGFLAGIGITAAAGFIGKKVKDGVTKHRGNTTKSEIEASIFESEETFKKTISCKFEVFFDKSYEALKQILRNREEQFENLKMDVEDSQKFEADNTLKDDIKFITRKMEEVANV